MYVSKKVLWARVFFCDVYSDVCPYVTGDNASPCWYQARSRYRLAQGMGPFMGYCLANNLDCISTCEQNRCAFGQDVGRGVSATLRSGETNLLC